ncbi:hypothetical protein [Mucilaginibacter antarcticus]|uniref:hypothetical protein n=1 Tax=Mucilaginibacter antarcticus TaxID=1855725 RepID=UPI0036273FD4
MKRSLVIFYALIIYAAAQLIWWGYQLVNLQHKKLGMILSEGSMFIIVLSFGAYYMHQSINRERKLQEQKRTSFYR